MAQKGFTLLEVLLVIALMSLTVGGGFTLQQYLASSGTLRASERMVVLALRVAQARSAAMQGDDAWSVRIASASVTVFKGDDYGDRDETFDVVSGFPRPLVVIGPDDIGFMKGSVTPTGTASLSLSFGAQIRHIYINVEGMVRHDNE